MRTVQRGACGKDRPPATRHPGPPTSAGPQGAASVPVSAAGRGLAHRRARGMRAGWAGLLGDQRHFSPSTFVEITGKCTLFHPRKYSLGTAPDCLCCS